LTRHLDGEDGEWTAESEEAEHCYRESLGECRGPVTERFNALPQDQQEAVAEKFE